jgi:SAM-dependent methyltransferase
MEILFDPELVVARRARAARDFDPRSGFLLDVAAEEMATRLLAVDRHFECAVEFFGATGVAGDACSAIGKIGALERIDTVSGSPSAKLALSLEDVPIEPATANLVLAPLSLHLVNDLPGSLVRLRRALKPDGLLMAAIPGSGTLSELSDVLIETEMAASGGVSPRVIPFADVRALGALLQRAGFALPVADVENYTVRYDSLFGLMKDLRAFGMTNMLAARSRKPVGKNFFLDAARLYAERYSDPDGRIRATFSIIYLSGWAPHESQQKPLKPGSAKMRLADALNPDFKTKNGPD